MELPDGVLCKILYILVLSQVFTVVFALLYVVGFIKAILFCPFVLIVIGFGNFIFIIGLCPLHLFWTAYCIAKSKKFGPFMKCGLIITLPIPIALWTVVEVVGTLGMIIWYGFAWPVMETFKAISRPGIKNKLHGCLLAGTWSSLTGACTVVRDFGDFSFHSYFSVMDEWLEAKEDKKPLELKVLVLPGCLMAAVFGFVVDVPMITFLVIYKAPFMLFKGWQRLVEDLVGRSGPFLETVCVPFAGFLILLWPFVVLLAMLAGILSSIGYGVYAAVVAYQENSTKKGLLFAVASVSLFDEQTNDFLYLQEGSCFPRPKYREGVSNSSQLLPLKGLHEQLDAVHNKRQLMKTPSQKIKELKAVMVWDNFFKGCERTGEEHLTDSAIGILDLEEWQQSKSKIINIGIPACTFLQCFLQSIKSGSAGFLMRDNVEITNLNRPEGRVFDWLFEPMCVMKEQIRSLKLSESEELYFCKLALYCGDMQRVEAWQNGGAAPDNEITRAQMDGICRRLHGFCLTLSRLPTFRRRLFEVVTALIQEAKNQSSGYGDSNCIETAA